MVFGPSEPACGVSYRYPSSRRSGHDVGRFPCRSARRSTTGGKTRNICPHLLTIFGLDTTGCEMDTPRPSPDAEHYGRQLEAVCNNATVGLFVMDARRHCTYLNPAAELLTGDTLAEVRGRPLHYFVHHTRPDGSPYTLGECPIDRALPENNQEQSEDVFGTASSSRSGSRGNARRDAVRPKVVRRCFHFSQYFERRCRRAIHLDDFHPLGAETVGTRDTDHVYSNVRPARLTNG